MSGTFSDNVSTVLFVDPSGVAQQRAQFVAKLKAMGKAGSGKRALYQEYVPVIGANGVLEGITQLWPKCHSEAHDLGKVIQATVQSIGTSLQVCRDGCYSGCMHGVLMEAFAGARTDSSLDAEQHVDADLVKAMMDDICSKNTTMTSAYSPGDCAHATGHALMVLADYATDEAVDWCDEFSSPHMRYYCATGAYMEYVTERDRSDAQAGKRALYPCDVGQYPASCTRYKMVHVIARLVKQKSDVQKLMRSCNQLTGRYRLGCYHGAGNGFMGMIIRGIVSLSDVCGQGTDDEKFVCIEGAMERMAKYHPVQARKVCTTLASGSQDRATCDAAVARGMYDMEKDLRLYVE